MDKYDTLEYSWVKATSVSVLLWIYLCALINTNTHIEGSEDPAMTPNTSTVEPNGE